MMTPQEAADYIGRINTRIRLKTSEHSVLRPEIADSYEELLGFISGIVSPDVLLELAGISVSGNVVTFQPLVSWRIDNNIYQKVTNSVFTVNFTSNEGFARTDLVYADRNNELAILTGLESDNVVVAPALPPNCVAVAYLNIFEDYIQDPLPDFNFFLTKSEALNLFPTYDFLQDNYFTQAESDLKYIFASPSIPQVADININGDIYADYLRAELGVSSNAFYAESSLVTGNIKTYIDNDASALLLGSSDSDYAQIRYQPNSLGDDSKGRPRVWINRNGGSGNVGVVAYTDDITDAITGRFIQASPSTPQVADIDITGNITAENIYSNYSIVDDYLQVGGTSYLRLGMKSDFGNGVTLFSGQEGNRFYTESARLFKANNSTFRIEVSNAGDQSGSPFRYDFIEDNIYDTNGVKFLKDGDVPTGNFIQASPLTPQDDFISLSRGVFVANKIPLGTNDARQLTLTPTGFNVTGRTIDGDFNAKFEASYNARLETPTYFNIITAGVPSAFFGGAKNHLTRPTVVANDSQDFTPRGLLDVRGLTITNDLQISDLAGIGDRALGVSADGSVKIISGGGGASYTFSKGLTEIGGSVKLGGDSDERIDVSVTDADTYNSFTLFQGGAGLGSTRYDIPGYDSISGYNENASNTDDGVYASTGVLVNASNQNGKNTLLKIGHINGAVFEDNWLLKGAGDAADYSANKTAYSYVTLQMLQDAIFESGGTDLSNYYTKLQSDGRYIYASPATSQDADIKITGSIEANQVSSNLFFTPADGRYATANFVELTSELTTLNKLNVYSDASLNTLKIPTLAGVGDRTIGVDSNGNIKLVAGGGGSSYTFNNGLTEIGGVVKLGGAITEQTIIGNVGEGYQAYAGIVPNYGFAAAGGILGGEASRIDLRSDQAYFAYENASGAKEIVLGEERMLINDVQMLKGLEYGTDYSANWTAHSLVTKKWVIDNFSTGGAGYTFNNGLTNTAGNVGLGGDATWNYPTKVTIGDINAAQGKLILDGAGSVLLTGDITSNSNSRIVTQNIGGDYYNVDLRVGNFMGSSRAIVIDNVPEKDGFYNIAGIEILDDITFKGAYYAADYSIGRTFPLDDLWIPTAGWVNSEIASLSGSFILANPLAYQDASAWINGLTFGSGGLSTISGNTAMEYKSATGGHVFTNSGGTIVARFGDANNSDINQINIGLRLGFTPAVDSTPTRVLTMDQDSGLIKYVTPESLGGGGGGGSFIEANPLDPQDAYFSLSSEVGKSLYADGSVIGIVDGALGTYMTGGKILFNNSGNGSSLLLNTDQAPTSVRNQTFQDKDGVIALLSDISAPTQSSFVRSLVKTLDAGDTSVSFNWVTEVVEAYSLQENAYPATLELRRITTLSPRVVYSTVISTAESEDGINYTFDLAYAATGGEVFEILINGYLLSGTLA